MAIDFNRFLQQAGSGYIQAKIRNTEANDQLFANLAENFGNTYYQEILPNTIAAENVREKNYVDVDTIASAECVGGACEIDF